MVKTRDYLYLNNEIYYAKHLKMSEPCARRNMTQYAANITQYDTLWRKMTQYGAK